MVDVFSIIRIDIYNVTTFKKFTFRILKNQNTTTIDNLLTLRIPFYREADLHILINDESVELIVQKVLEGLTKLINAQEDSF